MSHHNKEMLQEVQRKQDIGSCEQWLSIMNDRDYLLPIKKKPGLFVRRTGCCIYKCLCVATKVPLAEIYFCISSAPLIIHGTISYTGLDSLVSTAHSEIISCSDQFSMIVKTTKHVWVTINRRAPQIAKLIPIHEKVSKIAEDQITTLYTPAEFNRGRIIIVFQAIRNPPTRRSWIHCVSWKNVLAVWVICWEGVSWWCTN